MKTWTILGIILDVAVIIANAAVVVLLSISIARDVRRQKAK